MTKKKETTQTFKSATQKTADLAAALKSATPRQLVLALTEHSTKSDKGYDKFMNETLFLLLGHFTAEEVVAAVVREPDQSTQQKIFAGLAMNLPEKAIYEGAETTRERTGHAGLQRMLEQDFRNNATHDCDDRIRDMDFEELSQVSKRLRHQVQELRNDRADPRHDEVSYRY